MNPHRSATPSPSPHPRSDRRIYRELAESPLYRTYRTAFINATGLNLRLLPLDDEIESGGELRTEFCRRLNGETCGTSCRACSRSHDRLKASSNEKTQTITCFAGMRETAVPVRAAGNTVAFLTTGQVFTEAKKKEEFAEVKRRLSEEGYLDRKLAKLFRAWTRTPVVARPNYEGAITLLSAFGLQLSELLNQLLLERHSSEPPLVTKAKRFVDSRIKDRVCLKEVSEHVGVSTFYFCKIFRRSTGMTLTEYVNRQRIEIAKRRLLESDARVTDVAFDTGYQSLSQFNRSFLKYVGESPTQFRRNQSMRQDALANAVA